MFVGVNIDGRKERRIVRTSTPWRFDGRLDVADQIGDEVYSEQANLLDRGHMVRREDPIWGGMKVAARANVDTFHFTNAAPQMGVVNQRTWLGLEQYVLRNTRDDDMAVSVFTGPVFTDDDFPYRGALIPKSFWKVVAVITEDGRPSATAYEISQADELSALEFVCHSACNIGSYAILVMLHRSTKAFNESDQQVRLPLPLNRDDFTDRAPIRCCPVENRESFQHD